MCQFSALKLYTLVPDRATRNSNTQRVLTLKTQTWLNLNSNKPEKLVLLEPKLEILEQDLSLIQVRTQQFESRWNLKSHYLKLKWGLTCPNEGIFDVPSWGGWCWGGKGLFGRGPISGPWGPWGLKSILGGDPLKGTWKKRKIGCN